MACGRFDGANTGLDGAFRHGRREGVVHGIRVVEFDIAYRNAMGLGARLLAFLHYAARATWLARAERWDVIIASSIANVPVDANYAARPSQEKCLESNEAYFDSPADSAAVSIFILDVNVAIGDRSCIRTGLLTLCTSVQ